MLGAALDSAGGEALLGDGLGHMGGVLPEGELHDPEDQEQEQRSGDHQLGRGRAALVWASGRRPADVSIHGLPPVEMWWAVVRTFAAMMPTAVMAIATSRAMTT